MRTRSEVCNIIAEVCDKYTEVIEWSDEFEFERYYEDYAKEDFPLEEIDFFAVVNELAERGILAEFAEDNIEDMAKIFEF